MKITVIGTGYVGLSTGVCLAEIGHQVICIDIDEQKINGLRRDISPIYEPGLENLLVKNAAEGRLHFTTSHKEGLNGAEIIIIAVGTPTKKDGEADLSFLKQAAKDISSHINQNATIVIKSTVPVGTNESIKKLIEKYCSKEVSIDIVSNPEFLRQGSAILDSMKPDRIIIGSENNEIAEKVREMYCPLNAPIILTSIRSAEMIKYASNAFLASKICFINEIANLCEAIGANIEDVAKGMGKDKRIGESFLQAGIGYGGSCFPKDVKALYHSALLNGMDFSLLKEIMEINDQQHELLVRKALHRIGNLKGKKIAILGLSFKPETDDMRKAPSIKIIESLTMHGAEVAAYDPVAMVNAKKIFGDSISFASSAFDAVVDADALFIVTEWKDFIQLDLANLIKKMKVPIIFDGRNCFEESRIKECSKVEYYPVGKPAIIIGKV